MLAAALGVGAVQAASTGRSSPREGRSAANTTATRFDDFAAGLAEAFRAAV
jgi:hypothetical protein